MATRTESTTQTLHFWTTGEGFTGLLQSFYSEGRFSTIEEILLDGGLPPEMAKVFFLQMGTFTGSTKNGGDLCFEIVEQPKNFSETLYWAVVNCVHDKAPRLGVLEAMDKRIWGKNKNLVALGRYIPREQVINLIYPALLRDEGYGVNPDPAEQHMDGAVLQNGDYVTCGFQQHRDLYPILSMLGLASSGDWTQDDITFHISSGLYSGTLTNEFHHPDLYERRRARMGTATGGNVTKEQLRTLVKYRENIRGAYGDDATTMEDIRRYIVETEGHGGKWGNLVFLREFYPGIALPNFDKSPLLGEVKQCLRTSPKHSIAGLLESHFEFPEGFARAEQQIRERFERFKDVRADNELHMFYQQYIEGRNGVAHYTRDGFTHAVSAKRGAIVQGEASGEVLGGEQYRKLREVCAQLYKDLDRPIQVEFVTTPEGALYLLQLRPLENEYEYTVKLGTPDNVIAAGTTFSKGNIKVAKADILIVDEDCDSEALLGKKALIVKSKVEFSHILALSKALRIPSIYGVGNIEQVQEWQDASEVQFFAYNKEGFICKA